MTTASSAPHSALGIPRSDRRHFLAANAMGIGSIALAWLLNEDRLLAEPSRPELEPTKFDLLPKPSHAPPRARAMISLFMQGGPSHIDLFDPKPKLNQLDGQGFPGEVQYDNAAQASAKVLGCPWNFRRCGQSGIELSELLPGLAQVADQITLIRSMKTGVSNHGQSIFAMNTGRPSAGRPTLGSWMTYALGTESQDLPAFVVLTDPDGLPVEGVRNWTNGWLPSLYQGTVVRPREPRILNLDPPPLLKGEAQRQYLAYLDGLNRRDLERHPGELDLEARIASYELAARMQTTAKEALDLSGETESTRRMYGLDEPATQDFAARCLIARRLVERGVRFVQLFTRYQFWDHHGAIRSALPAACKKVDQPSAALVMDLKQRGLLDTTLVHWGGEMGRLPVIQNDAGPDQVGRDHNTHGFSMWLAGGGVRAGYVHGATDEFGHKAVADVVTHNDYHATLLHFFGLDYQRLVYRRNGQEQSLVDKQECRVVRELLA
ncbi:MAG TPA: DUF1501 domain-containing protein [Pirellulales bacterium]|nr:DUF1501 domain-containing protein [Pirellulales bacterium]